MYTGVNNGTLEKLVLNQFRKIKVRITDVANTYFYVNDPGDSMENGSNGSTNLKQTAILRGNRGRVNIDPVFIRTINYHFSPLSSQRTQRIYCFINYLSL